jgi:hypothetical protein
MSQDTILYSDILPDFQHMEWSCANEIHCDSLPENASQAKSILIDIFTYSLLDAVAFHDISNKRFSGIMRELRKIIDNIINDNDFQGKDTRSYGDIVLEASRNYKKGV